MKTAPGCSPMRAGCSVPLGQTMAKKLLLSAPALRVLCFPSPPSLPCRLPGHEHPAALATKSSPSAPWPSELR
ncbi:unnamed protein product [Rangifer tarandus platyrhynchus]|uniref:Uncharacterized protein n=2 Tax=Rangifer tarandus platyrhynchus TaxID=3082113 RepID=A0ABN8YPQ9_RANTA|nr:unnamed protein product [Rangifer tarandus platyrhynchus]CAI9701530.1 unnamed protein product [Rangifer tarandus platyrhynchus]